MTNKLRWKKRGLEWSAEDRENNLAFRIRRDKRPYVTRYTYYLNASVLSGTQAGERVNTATARSLDRIKEVAEEMRPVWAQQLAEGAFIGGPSYGDRYDNPSKLNVESPGALNDRVYADFGLSRLEFREYEGEGLAIEMIAVPEEDRGQGRLRGAMEEIVKWADHTGTTLYLTPMSEDPSVSGPRLKAFYRSLGFVDRQDFGDFFVRETMMREPRPAANPSKLKAKLLR